MKLEVGKCYRARGGQKFGPLGRVSSPNYPFTDYQGHTWTADGSRFMNSAGDATDLVAEWVEENPPCVAQELADEPILDAAFGQQKAEPAWKQDGGKPRMDLIAPEMLFGVAEVLRFGAAKYAERNWEAGMSWGRCFGALMRHLWAWWRGEANDPETGFSHLWHAACCLMFLIAYEERKIGTDDRKITVDSSDG